MDFETLCRYVKHLTKREYALGSIDFFLVKVKVLGSGAYGITVQLDTHSVVKFFTSRDVAYRCYLDLATSHKSDYLPRIYAVRQVSKNCFAVHMEKLKPIRTSFPRLGSPPAYQEFKRLYLDGGEGSDELVEFVDLMVAHADGLRSIQIDINDDLHNGNAMFRGEQLVITDPWCYGETYD